MEYVNNAKKIVSYRNRAGREAMSNNYESTNCLSPSSRTTQEGKIPQYIQDIVALDSVYGVFLEFGDAHITKLHETETF